MREPDPLAAQGATSITRAERERIVGPEHPDTYQPLQLASTYRSTRKAPGVPHAGELWAGFGTSQIRFRGKWSPQDVG